MLGHHVINPCSVPPGAKDITYISLAGETHLVNGPQTHITIAVITTQAKIALNTSPLLVFFQDRPSAMLLSLLSIGGCVARTVLTCLLSETMKKPEIHRLREPLENPLEASHIFVKANPRVSGLSMSPVPVSSARASPPKPQEQEVEEEKSSGLGKA